MARLNSKSRTMIEKICRKLSFLNIFIPKRKRKILIFNSSLSFQNNYAMYNYLIEEKYNDRYKIYYFMPRIKEHIEIRNNVILGESFLIALYHYLTAKYVFFDTGNMRIKPNKQQIVMNLWHGVPFKAIGFLSKSADKSMPKDLMNSFSKILVSSQSMNQKYIDSFLLSEEQIFYGGQPRNDLLISKKEALKKLGLNKKKYKKIIMWMTTYRISKDNRLRHTSDNNWSNTNLPLLTNQENIDHINKVLNDNDILLIIKHHTTGKLAEEKILETENIKILEEDEIINNGLQLYEILGECDAVITDYSSVFIDYLLVDRPIGFIIDDIEDYKKNNGFNFENPLSFMPGDHIQNIKNLATFLINVAKEKDDYNLTRQQISTFFNEFNKENNREYILGEMGIKK